MDLFISLITASLYCNSNGREKRQIERREQLDKPGERIGGMLMQYNIWYWIWKLSEWSGIGLGRFAPFVFSRMIDRKGKRIK